MQMDFSYTNHSQEYSEGGPVILVHIMVPSLQQESNDCGGTVELLHSQTLYHLPVPTDTSVCRRRSSLYNKYKCVRASSSFAIFMTRLDCLYVVYVAFYKCTHIL